MSWKLLKCCLVLVAVSVGALAAEPRITFLTHVDAAACERLKVIIPYASPCAQNVFFIVSGDVNITRYLMTVNYVSPAGETLSQNKVSPTDGFGNASAGFYLDNVKLISVSAEPIKNDGPAAVREERR